MFRRFSTAVIVAAFAASPAFADDQAGTKASFDAKTGQYCLTTDAITGTRLSQSECHSVADWAKQGVTFGHAPRKVAAR